MTLIGIMSSYTGPVGHQDLPAMETNHWHITKKARDREDAKLAHEHALRQDHLERGILELQEERAKLHHTLKEIDANLKDRIEEKHRLRQEHESRKAHLYMQRQDEDVSQQNWFARARESARDKEMVMSKAEAGAPDHDRSLPDPAAGWTSINAGPLRRSSRVQVQRSEKRPDHGNLFGSVFHNPVDEDAGRGSRDLPLRNTDTQPQPPAGTRLPPMVSAAVTADNGPRLERLERVNVIRPKQERHSSPSYPLAGDVRDDSPEGSRRSSRGRKSLPSVRDPASQLNSPVTPSATTDDNEITRESLALRDNGSVITQPPMFTGVPLEKIDEHHPFWNPEWEPLDRTVQAALDKWKERLENLRNNPDAVRHTMFLANRQVNRGQAVLDFLRDGCFHPLQFASREMMDKCYKTFINYDTVFRLVNVHEELKKFDLEVSPLQWLRQRLYEISIIQGEKFSLSKTTHDLYHDLKLKALREKHGFGNIGRPSGYKVGDKGGLKGASKLKPKKEIISRSPSEQSEPRRRTRRSFGQVDPEDDPRRSALGSGVELLEPLTPRAQKRPRLDSTAIGVKQEEELATQESEAALADLEYEGYSSTDSFSSGRIMHLDFRVYQVKTRALTTPPDVTQYWTWKPEENQFEHQVLRDTEPTITWGTYREPEKFNCGLSEIQEIRYAADSQKVLVIRANDAHGDVLVHFKRDRTKKRFLAFAKKKGVRLAKNSKLHLEEAWDAMNSAVMSDGEA
ncbi:hypothetical protein F4808DRAFT_384332 [Astrocystis sublimbata]|nr:hypothetical protein F4808DRAFT_384332 [Astrocystis sublimbata]